MGNMSRHTLQETQIVIRMRMGKNRHCLDDLSQHSLEEEKKTIQMQ